MVRQNKWVKYVIGISLLQGGCMKHSSTSKEVTDQYERVQDYKGEGYRLTNGAANDKVAEENREEVEKAVKAFFIKNYETGVKIHNLVGNKDGVTVFVESTGPVHFYTYAIVPFHYFRWGSEDTGRGSGKRHSGRVIQVDIRGRI